LGLPQTQPASPVLSPPHVFPTPILRRGIRSDYPPQLSHRALPSSEFDSFLFLSRLSQARIVGLPLAKTYPLPCKRRPLKTSPLSPCSLFGSPLGSMSSDILDARAPRRRQNLFAGSFFPFPSSNPPTVEPRESLDN